MIYRVPRDDEWTVYEQLAQHPLQSKAWGDFRAHTGVVVERVLGFEESKAAAQMEITFHGLPHLPYTVGYYPKGAWPDASALTALRDLGVKHQAILIKIEPDVSSPPKRGEELAQLERFLGQNGCEKGRALFTPYTFVLDLTKTETEWLAQMKPKTRYNVRLAVKKGVTVTEDSTESGFAEYLRLLELTTKRQQFFAHTREYHTQMWQNMYSAGIARLLKATYEGQTLAAWVLFVYKNRLFYPYGASSRNHKELMASNLVMWEAMKLGKKLGCTEFDLWGALGPNPDPKDPWLGFHTFKEGYGGQLTKFVGSYDLIIDPQKYRWYRILDRWRWRWLRFRAKLPF